MFIERGDNLTHGQSLFSDTCITVVFIAFSIHTNIVVYPCHHLSIVLLSDLYVVLSFIISSQDKEMMNKSLGRVLAQITDTDINKMRSRLNI